MVSSRHLWMDMEQGMQMVLVSEAVHDDVVLMVPSQSRQVLELKEADWL